MQMRMRIFLGLLVCFSASAYAAGLTERLRELKESYDQGLITQQEFDDAKKRLLEAQATSREAPATLAKPSWICTYSNSALDAQFEQNLLSFDENASAGQIVRDVLDAAGLAPNFIVRAANVPNAAATIFGQDRYILYEPNFIASLKAGTSTNWAVYSVMAHEIGHHLQGHTIQMGGSRPSSELEADEFSGSILFSLGASLAQAKAAMERFGTPTATTTHPAKQDRLVAIEKGWKKARQRKEGGGLGGGGGGGGTPVAAKQPCTHQTSCTHLAACQHVMQCQHPVPCQHSMPCQHPMMTPMGIVGMHPFDSIHLADAAHPADTMHAGDPQHLFDVLHPDGDPVTAQAE